MNQIAYLIEPTSITNTGIITGKSLRTYEVTYEIITSSYPSGYTFQNVKITPTGFIYSIKNGKISHSKTSAKLANKYISSCYITLQSSIDNSVPFYGSALFTDYTTALLAKAHAIKTRCIFQRKQLMDAVTNIDNILATTKDTDALAAEHPELFI